MQKSNDCYNFLDKKSLIEKLMSEEEPRLTISFYRYAKVTNIKQFRDEFFKKLNKIKVLGRIYLAEEGINAQISIPQKNKLELENYLDSIEFLKEIPLKVAIEERKNSFLKLVIKIRKKLVSDGLVDNDIDINFKGKHISPQEFHKKIEQEDSILIDVRNHYESEIGHFKGAIRPQVDTFRESLPIIKDIALQNKTKSIYMYCTGGIRCEKASAYLKKNGLNKVYQLEGGIINYVNEIKKEKLESKFVGSNFVFDDRLTEKATNDVISQCHQCGEKSSQVINCRNDICHRLFIQCDKCSKEYNNCCCDECNKILFLPEEEQQKLRKQYSKTNPYIPHKSQLRPRMKYQKQKE